MLHTRPKRVEETGLNFRSVVDIVETFVLDRTKPLFSPLKLGVLETVL